MTIISASTAKATRTSIRENPPGDRLGEKGGVLSRMPTAPAAARDEEAAGGNSAGFFRQAFGKTGLIGHVSVWSFAEDLIASGIGRNRVGIRARRISFWG